MKKLVEQVVEGIAACGAWGILARSELLQPGLVSWLHSQVVPAVKQEEISKFRMVKGETICIHPIPEDFMLFFCESSQDNMRKPIENKLCGKNQISSKQNEIRFRRVGIHIQEPTRIYLEVVLRSLGVENCSQGSQLAVAVLREARERLPERPEYRFHLSSGRSIARHLNEFHVKNAEEGDAKDEFCSSESSPSGQLIDALSLIRQAMKGFLLTVVHPEDMQYIDEIVAVFEVSRCPSSNSREASWGTIDWALSPQSLSKLFKDANREIQDQDTLVANVQLLFRCLSSQKKAIVLGDPGAGKTTCQKYLQAMLQEHGMQIDVCKIYHASLTIEELLNHGLRSPNQESSLHSVSAQPFLAPHMCSKPSADEPRCESSAVCPDGLKKISWVIFDGIAGGEASDSLCCLFEQMMCPEILRSAVYVAGDQCVLWEADSLKDAPPSLCSAPIAHIKPFKRNLHELLQAEMSKLWNIAENCENHSPKEELDALCNLAMSIIDNTCFDVLASTALGSRKAHAAMLKDQIGRRILALFASLGEQVQLAGKV